MMISWVAENPLHHEAPFVELRLMEEWDIINTFERIFDSKDVSNKVKVKSISMELKGRASDWWEQIKATRKDGEIQG